MRRLFSLLFMVAGVSIPLIIGLLGLLKGFGVGVWGVISAVFLFLAVVLELVGYFGKRKR
jgi:hypothetical protein